MKLVVLLSVVLTFLWGTTAIAQHFPNQYTGTYKGTLYLFFPNGNKDSVQFELILQPTEQSGRWTNTVRYLGNNGAIGQVKDYELVLDTTTNDGAHFILDEKDGILITETRINNTLYAVYTVDHMSYVVTTSFYETYIDYELSCYNLLASRSSESEPDEENIRWKVDSFPLLTVQKGRLYKQ